MIIKIAITVFIFLTFNSSLFAARYFAEINPNNSVKRVIVADSLEWCTQAFGGTWIETFINSPDKNYAGKGHDYFEVYKDFVSPQPYPSWILNNKRKWVSPKTMPSDGKRYKWDESTNNWIEF